MSIITKLVQIIFTFVLIRGFHADQRDSFWRKTGITDVLLSLSSTNVTTTSASRCAATCLSSLDSCLSFAFHKADKQCFSYGIRPYSTDIPDGTTYPGIVYYWTYVDCVNGYTYNQNLHICVRIYTNLAAIHNQKKAQQTCSGDGAYLLLMDSSQKALIMHDFVEAAGEGGHNYYVGGDDNAVPGNYTWFDGRPVNSSLWYGSEPDTSKHCIVALSSSKYSLMTVSCGSTWHYLCEMPVF